MQDILKTHQISAGIIELIEESEQFCYLVTPYLKPWPLLDRVLQEAAQRDKSIVFIIRNDRGPLAQAARINEQYGHEVIVLERLHTKLYLNEKRAILSSMNLYDSSQERNYELAVQFRGSHAAGRFKKDVIDRDLLVLPPVQHLKGRFYERAQAEIGEMAALASQFERRGFCVQCGNKIELEPKSQPHIVRCRPCWASNPNLGSDPWRRKIKFCHYCGEAVESVLAEPFHHDCSSVLRRYNEWRRSNAPTVRPSPA